MTSVYWLEQSQNDLPLCVRWLSDAERVQLARFRIPKRRSEWLLGRWTAKRAIAQTLNLDERFATLGAIELVPGTDGAPAVRIGNRPSLLGVSISHTDGRGLCTVASPGAAVGCDMEAVVEHSAAFVTDYFCADERKAFDHLPTTDDAMTVSLVWSAKESVLKLLHTGLRLDTRSVSIRLGECFDEKASPVWHPFRAAYENGAIFRGWWQHAENFVRTMAAFPPPAFPIQIRPDRPSD